MIHNTIMNNELVGMLKGAILTYFKVGTEERHDNPQSRQPVRINVLGSGSIVPHINLGTTWK